MCVCVCGVVGGMLSMVKLLDRNLCWPKLDGIRFAGAKRGDGAHAKTRASLSDAPPNMISISTPKQRRGA